MKIFKYDNMDHYRKCQEKANIEKIDRVWVLEEEIITSLKYADPKTTKLILCHGTRNGAEIKFFQKHYPNATVWGTEISKTANRFPNTIRHDFQKPHDKFNKNCDIVYSNSFDHTIDPVGTLNVWKNQLKDDGLMLMNLGWEQEVNKSKDTDPLEFDNEEEWFSLAEQCGLTCETIRSWIKGYGDQERLSCRLYKLTKILPEDENVV